jgi:hypothetical protein
MERDITGSAESWRGYRQQNCSGQRPRYVERGYVAFAIAPFIDQVKKEDAARLARGRTKALRFDPSSWVAKLICQTATMPTNIRNRRNPVRRARYTSRLGAELGTNSLFVRIVETSPGRFQVYWLVEKFPLDKFADVQRAIAKRFDGDPAVALLTACARVPGFFHQKGDPCQVKIVSSSDHDPFSENEIVAEFPPEPYAHKPSGSFVVLRKNAPVDCAREFVIRGYLQQGIPCLHRYRDTFFEWKKSHFSAIDEARIRAEVYEFLHHARVKSGEEMVPFNPLPGDVNAVLDALRSGVYLDNNAEPPFWMSPLNHRSGDNLIAFQNGLLDLSTGELEPHSP